MPTADFSVADLVRAMDRASDDVKRDVVTLIDRAAHTMEFRLFVAYPEGPTGNLRSMIHTTSPRRYATTGSGVVIPAKLVKASAPHVHIYQDGTKERFDATRGNARRGRSPAHGPIFERTAATTRQEMLDSAQRLLDRQRDL